MKRVSYAILLAALLVTFTSAFALPQIPWKFPAHTRIIYQINTAGLTSDQNVYVEMNIPQSIYDPLSGILDTNRACWYVSNNDDQELWPIAYYFSDSNPDQREMQPYGVISFYEYNVPQCGAGAVIKLPKVIRVFVPQLDDLNVGNYFALYEIDSNEFVLTFRWKAPDSVHIVNGSGTVAKWYSGQGGSPYTTYGYFKPTWYYANCGKSFSVITNVDIPVAGIHHLFIETGLGHGGVLIRMKDGNTVYVGESSALHGDCEYTGAGVTAHYYDAFQYLSYCGYSVDDVNDIIGVAMHNYDSSCGTPKADDLILVMSK